MVQTSTNWQRESIISTYSQKEIIAQFNAGELTIENADVFHEQGYIFTIYDGTLVDIKREGTMSC